MNVTREVVTDLLPIYFSDEASADTKVLVEEYFRQDPDFERIARRAAMPLETLRAAVPIAANSQKEKRDLESVLWGLRRRTWLLRLLGKRRSRDRGCQEQRGKDRTKIHGKPPTGAHSRKGCIPEVLKDATLRQMNGYGRSPACPAN